MQGTNYYSISTNLSIKYNMYIPTYMFTIILMLIVLLICVYFLTLTARDYDFNKAEEMLRKVSPQSTQHTAINIIA